MKRAITVLAIIAAIGVGAGAYYIRHSGSDIQVNTSPITRGDITDTVGATGTLQAVTTVQVGSQVSGNISFLGADFNSIVHKNQVIARLDPSLFDAQVQQAKANLVKSEADVEHNRVALTDADQKYTRSKELAAKHLLPLSDLDAAKIAVDSAQAQLQSSQATVEQSRATLNQNQVNLDHTVITAPIDGIIIQRSVDVGQTVAASMQAPTLFIIAADLTKMQVNANIDEADVGRIRPSQVVTFRVDAYPTEEFRGTVAQIRLQPVVVQNVTTYGTIIDVPNQDLKLKPGMTANLKVQIAKRTDVLRVPNAALRFRPSTDVFAGLNQPVPPEAQFAGGGRRGGGGANAGGGARGSSGTAAVASGTTAPPSGARGGSGAGDPRGAGGPGGTATPNAAARPGVDPSAGGRGGRGGPGKDVKDVGNGGNGTSARADGGQGGRAGSRVDVMRPKYGSAQTGETIDALFAPLQTVESQGRAWVFMNKQLKPVRVRLGITDGTNTELLSTELQPDMEVATGVVMGTRTTAASGGAGNPLLGPQRGPGGPGGPGRGR
jgi:HlyD family secretion protein